MVRGEGKMGADYLIHHLPVNWFGVGLTYIHMYIGLDMFSSCCTVL